jgi:hypothetical protein
MSTNTKTKPATAKPDLCDIPDDPGFKLLLNKKTKTLMLLTKHESPYGMAYIYEKKYIILTTALDSRVQPVNKPRLYVYNTNIFDYNTGVLVEPVQFKP